MDFDRAAERLARDQKKMRQQQQRRGAPTLSLKAKREADLRRKQQERMAAERQKKQEQKQAMIQYMHRCERNLGVKALSSDASTPLRLQPTSIYGDGDKIALPVQVLEFLTNNAVESNPDSPWIFRIAIPNPAYSFPASKLLEKVAEAQINDKDGDSTMNEEDEDEQDNEEELVLEAFMDELSHKYLAYTHGSVVEFTQEEGHVGLPATTAAALIQQLQQAHDGTIAVHRTVDPAASNGVTEQSNVKEDSKEEEMEKTPGHLAWGAFDVPALPVEVSLVKLPKGKACTLQPTQEAIRNGFYNLKDVKMVLEQSLIRTRATLSVHDLVHTWHRGVKYDLRVTEVKPATYNAVVCINTDITVDFAAPPPSTTQSNDTNAVTADSMTTLPADMGRTLGSGSPSEHTSTLAGRTLGSALSSSAPNSQSSVPTNAPSPMDIDLRPEPPLEQKDNICTVQIRGDGTTGRRRFDIYRATMNDLFDFASTIVVATTDFRLVARFPRRIFERNGGADGDSTTLATAGMQVGQELLMVEQL